VDRISADKLKRDVFKNFFKSIKKKFQLVHLQ